MNRKLTEEEINEILKNEAELLRADKGWTDKEINEFLAIARTDIELYWTKQNYINYMESLNKLYN